ncbi:MAG: hypothetical protein IPJ01_00535 [Micavibrio sp.]|nr:hypothetical protein [Micavibrio sp.]
MAALTEAGRAIGANTGNSDFQEPIKKLLAVAAFKFWTSVSGLGCSITLRIFYEYHHNAIKKLLSQISSGLERGLQFVTPEYLALEHLREAQEQSGAMKRFSTDVALSLTKALQPVSDSLIDIGQRITGGIGEAVQNAAGSEMKALAQNLSGIVESINSSRTEMDGVASTIRTAITEAAEALRAASGSASSEMTQQMHEIMTALSEESRKQSQMFDESMKKLSSIVDQAGESAGGKISEAAQTLALGMNGVSDGVRDAAGNMADRMQSLSSVMESVEGRMGAHIRAMDALTGKVQDTEQSMGMTSRMLTEAAAPVTKASDRMATSAENLNEFVVGIKQVITESHQSLSSLTRKMEETQETLQKVWQSYDQRFGEVDESLGKAVQGIVENVRDNIQSMEKFVGDMDKNLGHSITAFADSIKELTDTAESFEDASAKLLTATDRITSEKIAAE